MNHKIHLNQQKRSDSERRKIKILTTIITRISTITKNPQKIKKNKSLPNNLQRIRIQRQTMILKTKNQKIRRNPHPNKKKLSQLKTTKMLKTNKNRKSNRRKKHNRRMRKNHNQRLKKKKNQKITKQKSKVAIHHRKIKMISLIF